MRPKTSQRSIRLAAAAIAALGLSGCADDELRQLDRFEREGTVLACYKYVEVAAIYAVSKTLIVPAERLYVRTGDLVRLVEYPPIYQENRTLVTPEEVVLRDRPCPGDSTVAAVGEATGVLGGAA